jgi:DedD protein
MHARDPADLYKDRIEVSLDGRQIFYLFFGGAVIVGLVFVLGVMVGRRIEARGHVDPARAAAADPLAALDRLEGPGSLSFKGTLTGTQAPTEVERAIDELEKARGAAPAPAPAPKIEKKAEPKPEPKVEAQQAEPKAEAQQAKAAPKPEPKPELKPEPKVERAKIADRADRAEPRESRESKELKESRESKKKKRSEGDSEDTRFTLQLSSFQDRQEAAGLLSSLKAAGFPAYVTEINVGGKGTFYRVRYGSYRSADAANDARAELERVTGKHASVMRL